MVAEMLIIASLVAVVWWWRGRPQQARHAREAGETVSLLGYDDLPPIGAFDPVPEENHLADYVESGLEQLDSYLTGRDSNA
jgi:hypothetical protein